MEREGAFQLNSHSGLFLRTEPVKDILTTVSCPNALWISHHLHFMLFLLFFYFMMLITASAQDGLCVFGVCSELYTCFQKVLPTFPCRKHCQFSQRANELPGTAILMSRSQALLQSRLSPPGLLKGSHFASELHWL